MNINASKFEDKLVDALNSFVNAFNEVYSNRTLYGIEVTKASILEAKIDTLKIVIAALRESVK